MWDKIVKTLATAGGAVLGLLGGWSPLYTALCVLMVMDYATGLLVALRGLSPKSETGGISSTAGFMGLLKKGCIILVVLMGAILDMALGMEQHTFTTACTCYYIANEGISVLENIGILGVPLPEALRRALDIFAKKADKDDTQE